MTETIDMLLFCPRCGLQHVDEATAGICEDCGNTEAMHGPETGHRFNAWLNPPHKSHFCKTTDGGCGHVFRPADVATNGVAYLRTKGARDGSPVPVFHDNTKLFIELLREVATLKLKTDSVYLKANEINLGAGEVMNRVKPVLDELDDLREILDKASTVRFNEHRIYKPVDSEGDWMAEHDSLGLIKGRFQSPRDAFKALFRLIKPNANY